MNGRCGPIVRIISAAPTDVHVDLPDPLIATRTYAVAKFEASDPHATLPVTAIAFGHEDSSLVITVTIPPHQRPGVYTAIIIDRDTAIAYGNIRITVKPTTNTNLVS